MSTLTDTPIRTLADLLERFGGVPLERVRFRPPQVGRFRLLQP